MPFDPEIPQQAPEPQIPPFDVALKELVEALGAAPAAQALVEGGASPREAAGVVLQHTAPNVPICGIVMLLEAIGLSRHIGVHALRFEPSAHDLVTRRQMPIPSKERGVRVLGLRRLIIIFAQGLRVVYRRDRHQSVDGYSGQCLHS